MMLSTLARGAAAGAAGTAALNAVTYADMALRGRPASRAPEHAVEAVAAQVGDPVPGQGAERESRLQGLGALSGIATGVGIGVVVGLLRPLVTRAPLSVSGLGLGAAAMAATDVPMASLGMTDPRAWTASEWVSDAAPHAAYGLAACWTLRALSRPRSA